MNPPQQPQLLRMTVALIAATRFWRMLLLVLLLAVSTLAVMPRPPASLDFGWDKLNHVLAFAALALSAGLGFPASRQSRLGTALGLLAYGGVVEAIQLWVPQRSGEWIDLVADGIGIACGVLIASLLLHVAGRPSGSRRRSTR